MTVIDRILKKKGVFYGWVIVVASSITFFLAGGSRSGVSAVFLKPISDEFGWSRVMFAGASVLGQMQGAVEGVLIGPLTDKLGPRRIVITGLAIGAAGFIWLSRINSLPEFYFVFVALISMGLGAVLLPGQTVTANWFIEKRSRAFAILTMGFALGNATLTPAIGRLVDLYGWRDATIIIGIAVGLIGVSVASLLRHKPEQYGYLPDGGTSETLKTGDKAKRARVLEIDFTIREATRTKSFWIFATATTLWQVPVSTIMLHTVAALQDGGLSVQTAANFVGLTFIIGVAGRLFWGFLGDFFPKKNLLAIAVLIMGGGIFALASFTATWHVYLFAVFYGIGQGVVPIAFATRGEYWGRKSFATIGGILQAIATTGGILGPIYAGWVYDVTGSYKNAFYLTILIAIAAAVFYFFCRPPKAPKRTMMADTTQ